MSTLVSVQNLKVSFRLGKHRVVEAVRDISFDVPENGTLALVGESGSGKSVSAMSIVRLLPENAIVGADSRISFAGRNLRTASEDELRKIRGKDISVIFQEPMTSLNPVFTVGWQIAEVLKLHTDLAGRALGDRVLELMNEVGIPEPKARIDAYPHELSGGQQQRVMIAMAIACEPRLLIADEPTTALDVTVQRQILELMARLRAKHRMSMLFISHDLGLVGEIADGVVVMRDGTVRESGPVDQIFASPRDAYTKALLACRPRLDVKPRRLPVIDDFMRNGGDAPQITVETRQARAQEAEAAGRGQRAAQGVPPEDRAAETQDDRGGQGRELRALPRPDARRGGRVGLRQDHRRHDADAADAGHGRAGPVRRHRPAGTERPGDDGVPAQDPDHLPESVRQPQPALHGRADPDRADEDPRHRRERQRPVRSGRRAVESASGWPKTAFTSIRTSSRAGSGSASRSRAACR